MDVDCGWDGGWADLVFLLPDGGCNSIGIVFTRPERLLPLSRKAVGPSAPNFFHGGDGGLDAERDRDSVCRSANLRFLLFAAAAAFPSSALSEPGGAGVVGREADGDVDGRPFG